MEKKKNDNVFLIIIVITIAISLLLCILFATGSINLKTNTMGNNKQTSEKNDSSELNNEADKKISNEKKYSAILDEYKNAIKDVNNNNYKYVNENAINHYFNQKGTEFEFDFKYSFYDINKDGKYEMLINNNGIIDIFSYEGNNIRRLFNDNADCLAESRCQISIYEDGTIYFSGSSGASKQFITFYNINKGSSTLNTINSYYLKYSGSGSLTIFDENEYDFGSDTGTTLEYSSIDDLLNANINSTSAQVDLNNLDWTTIN